MISIDVDGNDFWIWQAIKRRPRVVVIEYNSHVSPRLSRTIPYDADFRWNHCSDYYGASLRALADLGRRKAYTLVHCEGHATNAFFVADECLPAGFKRRSVEDIYRQPNILGLGLAFPTEPIRRPVDPFPDHESRARSQRRVSVRLRARMSSLPRRLRRIPGSRWRFFANCEAGSRAGSIERRPGSTNRSHRLRKTRCRSVRRLARRGRRDDERSVVAAAVGRIRTASAPRPRPGDGGPRRGLLRRCQVAPAHRGPGDRRPSGIQLGGDPAGARGHGHGHLYSVDLPTFSADESSQTGTRFLAGCERRDAGSSRSGRTPGRCPAC